MLWTTPLTLLLGFALIFGGTEPRKTVSDPRQRKTTGGGINGCDPEMSELWQQQSGA
jgi:hypothetical protein